MHGGVKLGLGATMHDRVHTGWLFQDSVFHMHEEARA